MANFIGIAELAQAIGWGRAAIYRAIRADPPLPHYRLSATSQMRFVLAEVQDFIRGSHGKPAAQPRRRQRLHVPESVKETLRSQGFKI